jgi:hypothetical protein
VSSNVGNSLRGGGAGIAATAAMSVVMLAMQKAGLLGKAPPQKLSEKFLLAALRTWPRRSHRHAIGAVNHLAFGAAAGALFPLLFPRRALPARPRRVVLGTLYGAVIWTTMYGYVLPKLGLMPRPKRDRPYRPTTMAAAHLVYGAVLGALT